jgi:hypothetical protein
MHSSAAGVAGDATHTRRRALVDPLDWRKASCLGCNRRVVRVRDGWVEIGGTRNGSYLIMWRAMPLLAHLTDPENIPDEPLYLLGVAHQRCVTLARARIEDGSAALPDDLPLLTVELGSSVPRISYTLDKPAETSACPFSDTQKDLTREHVWPGWYSRDLQQRGATLSGDIVSHNSVELTVPVCGSCNNTWMSVLENDTRPLLIAMADAGTGSKPPMCLTQSQQTRLATWAIKTAYLIDAYEQPAIPRGFLHEFALHRIPNQWTAIWVAGYTPDVAARSEKRAMDFLTPAGPTNNSPNGFVVTFTTFNVLFQVVGHFNGGRSQIDDNRRQYDQALFRIWPSPGTDLPWPPAFGFSRVSWDGLAASIAGGARPEVRELD